MELLEQARAAVRDYDLDEDLLDLEDGIYWNGAATVYAEEEPLTLDVLPSTLHYHVNLTLESVGDEGAVKPGTSKYRGLPHLPSDMDWPEDMYFAAQFNLAELAEVDKSERLPRTGMLYLFFNGAGDDAVIYWDGPLSELAPRNYPEGLPHAEHYLDDFLAASATIRFEPRWIFYVNDGDSGDYEEFLASLPEDLVSQLDGIFGCGADEWDEGTRLYGRPQYWQGEDEYMDEDDDTEDVELLLFQDEFGEGHIHFWCDPDEAAAGDFSSCWVSYSGT